MNAGAQKSCRCFVEEWDGHAGMVGSLSAMATAWQFQELPIANILMALAVLHASAGRLVPRLIAA